MNRFLSLSLAAALVILAACSSNDPKNSSFVVAKGKGLKITRGELTTERNFQMKLVNMPVDKIQPDQLARIDMQILEQMINKKLLLAHADKATPETKKLAEEQLKRLQSSFPNEAAFKEQMEKSGLTSDRILHEMEEQAMVEKTLDKEINSKAVQFTPEEVQAFYKENPDFWKQPEQVKVRHILVPVLEAAAKEEKDAQRKVIEAARKRILGGEKFEQVAKEISQDSGSAQNGGSLPPFTRGQMVPEFEKAAFSQELNKVGPVITTQFGYHIIEVLDHKPARVVPFEEVKTQIEQFIPQRKRSLAVRQLFEKYRDDAQIKIFLPPPPQHAYPMGVPVAPGVQQEGKPAPAAK